MKILRVTQQQYDDFAVDGLVSSTIVDNDLVVLGQRFPLDDPDLADGIIQLEVEPPTLRVLMGATHRDAVRWCDERGIRRNEIGRTVFPSSGEPDQLRGRRGPAEIIYGDFTGSHRNFAQWHRMVTLLNSATTTERNPE